MQFRPQSDPVRKEKIAICEKFTVGVLDGHIRTP
jgi:hypothetical protein